jgi:AraC-like DNA-binding protein
MSGPSKPDDHPDRQGPNGPEPRRDGLVQEERSWQSAPDTLKNGNGSVRVALARWTGEEPTEVSSAEETDTHFITYSLREVNVDFIVGKTSVAEGVVLPQRVLLQGPTSDARRCVYRTPFDFFRIYFSQALLSECLGALRGSDPAGDIALFDAHFVVDPIMESLTRLLARVDNQPEAYEASFVEGVGLALAARLIGRFAGDVRQAARHAASPLAKVKLGRVVDYIEASLHMPIYLAELSDIAGLSRMHFAVQFRAATGYSPYAFIRRRRVDRAQRLLLEGDLALADVAALVGFRTPAHFSSAFKQQVGASPARWRRQMRT